MIIGIWIVKRNKKLLIYDAVGKQVRWLQYLLEKNNVTGYYFMKGGIKSYLEWYKKEQ